MKKLKEKKILPLLVLALSVPLLVGLSCSIIDAITGAVSELKDTDAQKTFLDEASEEFSKQEAVKMEGSSTSKDGDKEVKTELSMKLKGDDMEMNIKQDGEEMGVVVKGEYVYLGMGGKWVKMKKEGSEDYTKEFENLREDMEEEWSDTSDEDWDSGDVAYEGVEEVDGVKCHKYKFTDDGNVTYVYIGGKDKLLRKFETEGDETGAVTVSYDDVEINEPSGAEDLTNLSEEDAAMKMMELFLGSSGE